MENEIGKRLMDDEAISLEVASGECDLCRWLEKGYQVAVVELPSDVDVNIEELSSIQAYAAEILIHRRLFHVSSGENVN